LQNNLKSGSSPLLRPTEGLTVETRPTRGLVLPRSRGCAAAVRGRVVARGRESHPWLRPGVQLEERESGREEGSRVQVEGKNLLQRGEKLSLRSERKGKGTFA